MSRSRGLLVGILSMLLAAMAWLVSREPRLWGGSTIAMPLPVPEGDQEIAWIHTVINAASWERFVAGALHARPSLGDIEIDDSRAFLEQSTDIPELVLRRNGSVGKLRIRWYKVNSEANIPYWAGALARRSPAPLAIVGGGTSDRAVELAVAVAGQPTWRGPKPLLFFTTATANHITLPDDATGFSQDLMQLYPQRSFRICFTDQQIAQAILDFVWQAPDLRPQGCLLASLSAIPQAAQGPTSAAVWGTLALLAAQTDAAAPMFFTIQWQDDPYSSDLADQFKSVMDESSHQSRQVRLDKTLPTFRRFHAYHHEVQYSVGSFHRVTAVEANAVDFVLTQLPTLPGQRSLLVVPAAPAPTRRVLNALSSNAPYAGRHLVAVSGDAINFNTVYRDADLSWPTQAPRIPLVFFAHQNPVAWTVEPEPRGRLARAPSTTELLPPNSTEDVLHNANLVRLIAQASFDATGLVPDSDRLAERLRQRQPAFFDADGNRLGGSGEYVLCLRPRMDDPALGSAPLGVIGSLEVWHRDGQHRWKLIRSLPIELP